MEFYIINYDNIIEMIIISFLQNSTLKNGYLFKKSGW